MVSVEPSFGNFKFITAITNSSCLKVRSHRALALVGILTLKLMLEWVLYSRLRLICPHQNTNFLYELPVVTNEEYLLT